MRSLKNIRNLFRQLHVSTSTRLDEKIHAEMSRVCIKTRNNTSLSPRANIWRIIMESRITKLAVAAAIIVAVILGLNMTGGSDIASVTWAGMVERIENANTITWKTISTEAGKETTTRYMVLGQHRMRVELPDGSIIITDHQQERTLILDTEAKNASVAYARPKMFNYDNYFRNMSSAGISVMRIGSREIDGIKTIGFKIERVKGNNGTYGVLTNNEPIVESERIFWTDPETQLPVLIEDTVVGSEGRKIYSTTIEIVFGAELDDALFSLEPPSGYVLQYDSKAINQVKSAISMNEILKACMIYNNQHDQWPDNLKELDLSGVDVNKYIYLKPSGPSAEHMIVLHEAFDVWDRGINVGFNNYRVEFIDDELKFRDLLKNR